MTSRINHVILDMDGTLIGEDRICARPYLKVFLWFLFENFDTVSIWTAATESWYTQMYSRYIKPNMPLGKTFFKVWFKDKCKIDSEGFQYKPLKKFFKKYKGVSRVNTIIIDNDPSNYFYDRKNGVSIDTYLGAQNDTELLRVMNVLKIHMYYNLT